jgi:hypothetical protein
VLEAILATVPTKMAARLTDKAIAKEAWDSIIAARIGVNPIRRATLQRRRNDWENLAFPPGEQIEDFTLRLSTLKQQMACHGDEDLTEEQAVEKLLRAALKKYAQLVIAIDTPRLRGPHY